MKIDNEPKLDFDDVMILPKPTELSSRSEVNLEVSYITKHSKKEIRGIPVIAANMDSVGTISMARTLGKHRIFTALHKFVDTNETINFFKDNIESNYAFITSGNNTENLEYLIDKLNNGSIANYIPKICLDVANGYMYSFLDTIKRIRNKYPNAIIIAGNVCTPEGVENIIKAGADICKSGIGNGQFCETKNKAGVGCNQFSVAQECGQAANELNALCCSDGAIKQFADIAKCLGSGSRFVMAGSIFMGYDESTDSEWEYDENNNKIRMLAYGMSSTKANNKYSGGLKSYRTSEGREGWVDYKGSIANLIQDIKGGLSSVCTYTNTKNLENLHKNCVFVRNGV